MLAYAQDAQETDKPCELCEFRGADTELPQPWKKLIGHPLWSDGTEYRRKPRTIRIGNYDVPEPLRVAPAEHTTYYIPLITNDTYYDINNFDGAKWDLVMLRQGMMHLTREAAELHAKALISLTEQQ